MPNISTVPNYFLPNGPIRCNMAKGNIQCSPHNSMNKIIVQGGKSESCLAVLNNFYSDGVSWHDVACHHQKRIVCEDVEGHLQFARQTFPQLQIP